MADVKCWRKSPHLKVELYDTDKMIYAILIKLKVLNEIKQKAVLFAGESPPEGFPKFKVKNKSNKKKEQTSNLAHKAIWYNKILNNKMLKYYCIYKVILSSSKDPFNKYLANFAEADWTRSHQESQIKSFYNWIE